MFKGQKKPRSPMGIILAGVMLLAGSAAADTGRPPATGDLVTTTASEVPARPELKPMNLSPRLKLICGLADEKGYVPRLQAIHQLQRNLTEPEIEGLLAFLHQKADSEKLELLEFDALKNDIVLALLKQPGAPGALPGHLRAMFADTTYDAVWRDYCVQFLGQIYPKLGDDVEKAKIRTVFQEALKARKESFAGTALIALKDMADLPEFPKTETADAAMKILRDKETADFVKLTAMQIAAILKHPEALSTARKLLAAPGTSINLKASAVAAIGQLGGREDIARIEPLTRGGDVRVAMAARAALARLNPSPQTQPDHR